MLPLERGLDRGRTAAWDEISFFFNCNKNHYIKMIFLLLKLPAYNEKQKKKQPTCIPWTGTSRTDTWKPHQAETSSSCLWNTKLGAREKTNSKQNTKLQCTVIKQELLVYSHIPPHLGRSILSPVLTFPPPCESRDQSPALWMGTPNTTPSPLKPP